MPSQVLSAPTPTTNNLKPPGRMPPSPSMDDIISLRCRIVTLETELRLVNEKLVDSRNGTLYLVSLVGQNHKLVVETNQDQEIQTLRYQLEEEREANAQLKRLLTTSEWAKGTLETGGEPEETTISPVVEEEDGIGDLLGSISVEGRDQEMSKIQDDTSCSGSEKGARDGWANIQRNIDEKNANASKAPAIKRVRFLDHEHKRLAGFACYIEEIKDPHEYAEHWINYANEHHNHTADEWREYYESQIRPTRYETGTAQPVHMHSYSMDEVKQYDIPVAVQPVDSPLQRSRWASPKPISHWPAPQPRPHMNPPWTGTTYLSYEVTHFPASKDPGLRRTVLVSNIPIGMTLAEVFSQLESDRILEAKFAGTAGMKTVPPIMNNAAIVEFLDNEDAQAYVDVYYKHAVFDLKLIPGPTRPLRRARVDSGYD